MKKRKALILFGGLTVLLIGYVVWCSREFYIDAVITWDDEVAEKDRLELRPVVVREQCLRQPWSIKEMLYDVMHPYQVAITRVHISEVEDGDFVVKISGYAGEVRLLYVWNEEADRWSWAAVRPVSP